jgi:aspartyl-tRNA(Asn)/glutamyl-tRNA(Gln) amidotransferase subunit C
MATIDPQTVRKLAILTRLQSNPSDEFVEHYADQLSSVLDYLNELQEVDTKGVSATAIIDKNTLDDLRDDVPPQDKESYERVRQNILHNFPNRQGDLLVLPVRIID